VTINQGTGISEENMGAPIEALTQRVPAADRLVAAQIVLDQLLIDL